MVSGRGEESSYFIFKHLKRQPESVRVKKKNLDVGFWLGRNVSWDFCHILKSDVKFRPRMPKSFCKGLYYVCPELTKWTSRPRFVPLKESLGIFMTVVASFRSLKKFRMSTAGFSWINELHLEVKDIQKWINKSEQWMLESRTKGWLKEDTTWKWLDKQTNGGNTTIGADQYLSSLLQLAFVISKLLLKTDLLKGGRQKNQETDRKAVT